MKTAINKETDKSETTSPDNDNDSGKDDGINTTLDEMEAFYIVKAILAQKIPVNRIVHRDTKSYFGILLDDNNRKPICRLYLEGNKKSLVTFGEGKKEQKHQLESLDEIYRYSQELLDVMKLYE